MTSWVYVFSKFTPEALLFEALLIFTLAAGYAAFWILKKRKLGVIGPVIPAGLVKKYLNELIVDAESLRAQLFGLLAASGAPAADPSAFRSMATGAPDQDTLNKIAVLEHKVGEQSKTMDGLLAEKARMEKELADAKANASKGAGASPGDAAMIAKLQEKIALLESKLAEYSVIEDDLANLKRLQQENAQLKQQLAARGIEVPAGGAAPAPKAPEPATVAPTAEPAIAAAPPSAAASAIASTFATQPAAATAPTTPAAAPAAAPSFEGLVDQVEQSLKTSPLEEVGAPAVAAPALEAATPPAAEGGDEKSDADLVAEFEKMLNG